MGLRHHINIYREVYDIYIEVYDIYKKYMIYTYIL